MTLETGGRTTVAGRVMEILPRALYRVAIGDGHEVVAHAVSGAGRNFVRLVVGDDVTVELTARDRGRGRIVKRGVSGSRNGTGA
jgi:translation initiation factor IF-1